MKFEHIVNIITNNPTYSPLVSSKTVRGLVHEHTHKITQIRLGLYVFIEYKWMHYSLHQWVHLQNKVKSLDSGAKHAIATAAQFSMSRRVALWSLFLEFRENFPITINMTHAYFLAKECGRANWDSRKLKRFVSYCASSMAACIRLILSTCLRKNKINIQFEIKFRLISFRKLNEIKKQKNTMQCAPCNSVQWNSTGINDVVKLLAVLRYSFAHDLPSHRIVEMIIFFYYK